jgi:hypothetical protein
VKAALAVKAALTVKVTEVKAAKVPTVVVTVEVTEATRWMGRLALGLAPFMMGHGLT